MKRSSKTSALEKAIRFIAVRSRSTHEVRSRLIRYGLSKDEIEATIEHLTNTKLLDDLAFAKQWVETRIRSHSIKVLRYELANKKISQEIIDEVVKQQNDLSSLETILSKRLHLPKDKLIRYALTKRYSFEDIISTLRNLGL